MFYLNWLYIKPYVPAGVETFGKHQELFVKWSSEKEVKGQPSPLPPSSPPKLYKFFLLLELSLIMKDLWNLLSKVLVLLFFFFFLAQGE